MKPLISLEHRKENKIDGHLVWQSTLDDRYYVEVVRTEKESGYIAIASMFDQQLGDKLILQEEVWLNYGAQFGVDIENVNEWKDKWCDFIDNKYMKAYNI